MPNMHMDTGRDRIIDIVLDNSRVALGVTRTGVDRETIATFLTPAQAREIADWIKANVPEPEPQTLIDWEKIPVGGQFGFGKYEPSYPAHYVKDGEWSYRTVRGAYRNDDIRTLDPDDLDRGLTYHRPALPTKYAAVVKTTDGKLYTRADGEDPAWLECNTGGNLWSYDADLIREGFEVIFEGVDL